MGACLAYVHLCVQLLCCVSWPFWSRVDHCSDWFGGLSSFFRFSEAGRELTLSWNLPVTKSFCLTWRFFLSNASSSATCCLCAKVSSSSFGDSCTQVVRRLPEVLFFGPCTLWNILPPAGDYMVSARVIRVATDDCVSTRQELDVREFFDLKENNPTIMMGSPTMHVEHLYLRNSIFGRKTYLF